ncbi:MAG: translation elongation factor Ts [Bacteroidales bacterium]|jgi:elongation factor Ts|nr:translation elongation factor Ts [Bacteroidales bacterium]HOL97295.1 translation elongation factor Ts [Bacteroidales bacterium]HPD22867.1 translation elongation factor Ts [Bacteroidales bacterium]HRT00550.1 translation elongation factor Ts [Bacteroidales bacterium]HRT81013.1 translation elongation factor Ts [Bacteroidales bacterium]
MANITAADVSKLRQLTGAGMMDCKKALVDADGDFERAKEIIRERGLAIANKRSDREASEGAVLAKTTNNNTVGVIIALNCETDFVAKNQDFIDLAKKILDIAAENLPENLDALKNISVDGKTVQELVMERSGVTGEKMELAFYGKLEAAQVSSYIHMGNKLATVVGLNKVVDPSVSFNLAMQVAAMNPIAVDEQSVPAAVIQKELEIGREQARNEGKPENLLDKIAQGKLQKFIKESTLVNQEYIMEEKMTVADYLKRTDKDLVVTGFIRYALSN